MKTNKITAVPRLRFPEFRDDGDWEEVKLGEVVDYTNGKAHEQDIEVDGRFIVVNSKFIATSGTVRKYSNTANLLAKASDVPNGRAIAKCYLVESDNLYTVNQRIAKLTPKAINPIFLYYIVNRNPYFIKFDDGVKQTNLRKDIVLDCPLKLPTSLEQQKIADCLSSLDTLIKAEDEQLDTLKEYKAGLLQQLFPAEGEMTPKHRFAEFEENGNWEEVKLVDVAETSIGLVTTMTTSYVEKGIPLIRNSDIKPNAIRMTKLINLSKEFADKYENKKLLKNDIVTVHTGDIGVSAIVEQSLEGSLGFATLNTRVTSSSVSPEFVCWFFNSPEYKRFALSMATGDGRNNFNLRDFNKTILFIPDILEQQKLVNCLSSLDNLIQAKDEKIKTLKQHKQGLMQQLFPVVGDK